MKELILLLLFVSFYKVQCSCLEDGSDKKGGTDIFQRENVYIEECQRICKDDARCTFFTYQKSKKKCWLKSGSNKSVPNRPDNISGAKDCSKFNILLD